MRARRWSRQNEQEPQNAGMEKSADSSHHPEQQIYLPHPTRLVCETNSRRGSPTVIPHPAGSFLAALSRRRRRRLRTTITVSTLTRPGTSSGAAT